MGRNAAWASFTGLTLALAAAGVTAQPARSGLPPLPPELASKHTLDERALQALRPPGPAPIKAGTATTPAPTELVKAPTAPKPAPPPAMPPAAGPAPASPPARAAAPAQAPKMSLGLKSCKFEYKGKSTRLTLPHDTNEVSLEFKAEKGCLTAASSDQLWAEAAIRSFKQDVLVTLEPNPGVKPRTANLFVVAGDAPLEFTVTQEGKPAPVAAPAPEPTQAPVPAPAPAPIPTPVSAAPAPEASSVKVVEPAPEVKEATAEKQEPPKAMSVGPKNDALVPTPEAPKEPMLEVKRNEQKAPEETQPSAVATPAKAEPANAPIVPAAGLAVEVKETKAPVLADVVPAEGKKEEAPAKAEGSKPEIQQAPKVEPVKKADEVAKPSEPVKEPAVPTPAITPIPSTRAVSGLPPMATPVSPGDDYEEVDLSDEPAGGSPA